MVFLIQFAKYFNRYLYRNLFFRKNLSSSALPILGWASFKIGLFWTVFLPLKNMRTNMKMLTAAQLAGISTQLTVVVIKGFSGKIKISNVTPGHHTRF